MALARRHYNVGIDSKSSFSVCLLRSSGLGKFLLCKWCMVISSLLKHSLQERKAHSGSKQKITSPKRKKLGSFWDDSSWLVKRHKPTLVWGNPRAGDWEEIPGLWVAGKPAEAVAHNFPVLWPALQRCRTLFSPYVCECFACKYSLAPHACLVSMEAKRGHLVPWAGVTEAVNLSRNRELNPNLLERQPLLLTSETSLQPHSCFSKWFIKVIPPL